MPRYFLHMHNSTGLIEDDEGQEHPDLASARASAIQSIRSVASEEVRGGSLDLRGRIDITDEAGELLASVPFPEAIALALDEQAT